MVPKAVTLPLGDIRVSLSPTPNPSFLAMRTPMRTESLPLNRAKEPDRMLSAMMARPVRSAGFMPRTTAPWATPLAVAITWPSIIGVTRVTPGTARTILAMGS